MRPVVVFPDATAVVVSHLKSVLSVPVRSKVPTSRPASFVTVQRSGGAQVNVVTDDATLTVDAWASTDEAAHDLAQLARGHILSLVGSTVDGVPVYRVQIGAAPQYFPDPESQSPRYRMTVTVAVRGEELP